MSPGSIDQPRRRGAARALDGAVAVAVAVALAVALATNARAEVPVEPTPASVARVLDAGQRLAQESYDAGEYLRAAREWSRTAAQVPEAPRYRLNRAALHEYIADAYLRALERSSQDAVVDEARAVLEAYLKRHAEVYPDLAPSAAVVAAHVRLEQHYEARQAAARQREAELEQARRDREAREKVVSAETEASRQQAAEAARRQAEEAARADAARRRKRLEVIGAVGIGGAAAALIGFGVSVKGARDQEAVYVDNNCPFPPTAIDCASVRRRGLNYSAAATTTLVLAPALLAVGVTALVLSRRVKVGAVAIAAGPEGAGLRWSGRF